jgi:hypothetical protein
MLLARMKGLNITPQKAPASTSAPDNVLVAKKDFCGC